MSKIVHFVATTERISVEGSVEGLVRLFRDDIWKLHELSESVILNREPYFVVELMKELNRMLDIKKKLLTSFHLQMDRQTEHIN